MLIFSCHDCRYYVDNILHKPLKMKLADVPFYIDMICQDLSYDDFMEYHQGLFEGICNDEEISKKFSTITNSHQKFIEVLKNNEDFWEFFDVGCAKWASSLVVMAHSQCDDVRMRAAKNNKLIAHELMNDKSPDVRASCIYASTKISDVLLNDTHHYVRAVVAVKSEEYGLKLMNDSSDFVREWCAKWEVCARQYVNDKSLKVRWNALYQHKNLAELFINDESADIKLLCFDIDKSFASKLKTDLDSKIRKNVLVELPEMAEYFLNDESEDIRNLALNKLNSTK
ncbi:hypothetical protein URS_1848 [Acinetobacter ursingii]|nr:hypothetical protein URS_1848 [Acinetobacter ursingii]